MSDCCNDKECAIEALQARQGKTLRIVLAINVVMFFVELVSGLFARSTALLADSLDNLGDSLTYGLSIYAVRRGARAKARVALFKAALILIAGLFVLGQVIYAAVRPGVPVFETMGVVSLLALAANATCLALLWKHRSEDVNMSSVWECSRTTCPATSGAGPSAPRSRCSRRRSAPSRSGCSRGGWASGSTASRPASGAG